MQDVIVSDTTWWFLGRNTLLSAFDSFQKGTEGRKKWAQRQTQDLGAPTSATWHQQLHRDIRRWGILAAGLSWLCVPVSCSTAAGPSKEQCLVPALLVGARDRRLSWLVLPALEMKAKDRAQNKFAYIKKAVCTAQRMHQKARRIFWNWAYLILLCAVH